MALRDRIRSRSDPDAQKAEADKQVIIDTDKIIAYLKESRRRHEYEWFINDMYYNNNQYLRYNAGSRRVQNVSSTKINDKVVINKVKQQVRGIVNFLNAEHPEVGVRPGDQSDDAYVRAKKEKHLCDYWYRHLGINKTAKKISLDGAKYGIAWAKVLWDQDALAPTTPFMMDGVERDDTYGEVLIQRCDPFEVFSDPMAQDRGDMRFIAHAPTRTIGEIKNNPLYSNTDKVTPDNRLAASPLKQAEIRVNISNAATFATGQPGNMDTVVVWEIFRKLYVDGEWQVWVTTRTEAGILLRNEKWILDEFPFVPFTTDISGMLLESKGVIHDIREPNRALNEMVSQVHETARIMGKLNWLIPRGSNVNVITDQTGQFIEYDVTPGGAPRQADAINLPSYIMQHIGQLTAFMEDISGMHASFNGRAPFAQASGDLVDTLSEGDQNNLTTMRDNYNDFFVEMFKLALKTAKKNAEVTRKFPTSQEDEFGEVRWQTIKPEEINIRDDLDVSTGTQMPYSIAQKQQMYMNLWKEKAIQDPNVLFKLLEMPDIDNAMGDDEPHIERQLNELRQILDDKPATDPEIFENHAVHIATLDKFANGDRWYDLSDMQKKYVRDHRQKHIQFSIQLAQISAAQQMEPIKRSLTTMVRVNKMADTTAIERTQMLAKFGVQSDAAEVQLRGGLFIQDPAQAEMQAMNEDTEMLDMRAVHVSFADNHIVHLNTHGPVADQLNAPDSTAPDVVKKLFAQHIKDHIAAMEATMTAPGAVPNENDGMPNEPNLSDTGPPGQMPQEDTNIDENEQRKQKVHPMAKPAGKISPGTEPNIAPNAKMGNNSGSGLIKPKGGTNGKKRKG